MALIGTPNHRGSTLQVVGIAGTGDNAIVIELDDVSRFDMFALSSSGGAMDVDVSLDGTNFITAIALEDKKSTAPGTRVVVTAAAGLYYFEGNYKAVRVRQAGVTAVANAVLMCGKRGRNQG
jgi:hypothetical protein